MPIRINSFMGKIGWNARIYFPNLASNAYLKLQFVTRGKAQKKYVDYFLNSGKVPMPNVVNIETINRCNSTCAFCTANVHAEKRPLRKIEDDLYYSIIDQLADWGYKGHLTLYGNNEPWLDTRIVEFHKYAREKLPDSFIFMSTNGLMLTLEQVKTIAPYINQLIINNYDTEYKLHKNIQEIYDYIIANPSEFENLDIQIQMRYLKEVLTNRAGSAPNKQATEKVIKETCLLPFTDMWIMPNGKVGLCCCDNFEVTDFADLHNVSVKEAWEGEALMKVRRMIADGRQNYKFCQHCDFIDAGFRMQLVKAILQDGEEAAHKIGGQERMKVFKQEK
ncbi:radical SAM/SPASM domain-containing protein [Butyrivibrio sp. NC3005]|uniref:radical SAM/SPASM domain-containing protein n=1 Tax=Butyrivibrio sp. NC3005 TaxID=1280685 RepID=UPI0003FB9F53|nr:radical SAM/SPASM domain-containing protein [Butyrivibrio sp. NC3005]